MSQLENEGEMSHFLLHFKENRLKTFKDWPFDEDCLCTPQKLAEAGFYHCPTDNEPDVVKCYVCLKELDGWEPHDDPWKEHKAHASYCPLLKKKPADLTTGDVMKLEAARMIKQLEKHKEAKIKEVQEYAENAREEIITAFDN